MRSAQGYAVTSFEDWDEIYGSRPHGHVVYFDFILRNVALVRKEKLSASVWDWWQPSIMKNWRNF